MARVLYIADIDGDTSFQDVLLIVQEAGDTHELYKEHIFYEYFTPNSENPNTPSTSENVGSDYVMYFKKQLVTNTYPRTGEQATNYDEKNYKVEINGKGEIGEVSCIHISKINQINQRVNTPFERLDITDDYLPKEFRLKVQAIAEYKKKYEESPRQTEARENRKSSRYLHLFIAGATMVGNIVLGRFPLGRQISTTIGSIAGFLVTVENPIDPKQIRIISTYTHKESKIR